MLIAGEGCAGSPGSTTAEPQLPGPHQGCDPGTFVILMEWFILLASLSLTIIALPVHAISISFALLCSTRFERYQLYPFQSHSQSSSARTGRCARILSVDIPCNPERGGVE